MEAIPELTSTILELEDHLVGARFEVAADGSSTALQHRAWTQLLRQTDSSVNIEGQALWQRLLYVLLQAHVMDGRYCIIRRSSP